VFVIDAIDRERRSFVNYSFQKELKVLNINVFITIKKRIPYCEENYFFFTVNGKQNGGDIKDI